MTGRKNSCKCPTCGSLHTYVIRTGYTDEEQRLIERGCDNHCPRFVTVEQPIRDRFGKLVKFSSLDHTYRDRHREEQRIKRGYTGRRGHGFKASDVLVVDISIRRRPNLAPEALSRYCKRGHRLDLVNTYTYPNGKRQCRICHDRATQLSHERTKLRTHATHLSTRSSQR